MNSALHTTDENLTEHLLASAAQQLARCNAERDAARNERDALLEACEDASNFLTDSIPSKGSRLLIQRLDAAIALCKRK